MTNRRAFVPLESLVDAAHLNNADTFNLDDFKYSATVRGKKLDWLCLSRRLLWMACGHEYIEPEFLDWIDKIPSGEVLYDVGASNGIFSIYAAARGLRVIAFDPDPMNYFLLAYNNYLNAKSSGIALEGCYNLAISNVMAVDSIHIKHMVLGGHEKILSKAKDVFGNEFQPEYSHPVLKCALDDLIGVMGLPQPKYLKIDVDGSEADVLEGAKICLANVVSVFIELTEEFMNLFASAFFERQGFYLQAKYQVQNYDGLFNCIFERTAA